MLGGLLAVILATAGTACSTSEASTADGSSLLDDIREAGVLKVGTRVDNPPHSSYDDGGDWVGFDVDIATAIADRWGVRLELVQVDELTRISYLHNGRIDLAVASISKTVDRGVEVDFSQTYFFSTQTFLVRAGEVESYEDLVGQPVAASRGSHSIGNWQTWLADHGHAEEPDIEQFSDKRAAVAAVQQGAVAGWAEDYEVLATYAANQPDLTVLDVPGGIGVKLDGIAMRKDDSTLRNAVDLALQEITASGEYQEIYDRWFGPESGAPLPPQGTIEVWPHG
jgi:polar amino acid transport system substrate-binding protein